MAADDLPLPPDGLSYYQLLGVTEDATEGTIERAYRQLVRHYHPDHFDHWAASDITKRLRQARDTLTDPRARQRYNHEGHHEYTGEEPASPTDIKEWLGDINHLVDVEKQMTPTTVEYLDADADEIAGAFDLTDIDEVETEEEAIFDAEADTPSSTDWGAIREEATDTHRDDDASYADDPDINEIDPDPPPVDEEKRDPVDLSHEERVRQKVESRSRTMDPEKVIHDAPQHTTDRPERQDQSSQLESLAETGESLYKSSCARIQSLRSQLADDVLSRAHRQAWQTRIAMVILVFFAGLGVGEIASFLGISGLAAVLPRAETILGSPKESINIVLIAVLLVFGADQVKTERDTSRGAINVAGPPLARLGASMAVNSIGIVLVWVAVTNGVHPIRVVTRLQQGIFPGAVWIEMGNSLVTSAINTSIGVIMLVTLVAGWLLTFHALSRLVWYDRYCTGYRVLPAVWDILLVTPVVIAFWMFVTSARTFTIPLAVGETVINTAPEFAVVYGIYPVIMLQDAVVVTALVAPTFIALTYLTRRSLEIGGRYLRTELNKTDTDRT